MFAYREIAIYLGCRHKCMGGVEGGERDRVGVGVGVGVGVRVIGFFFESLCIGLP